MRIFVAILGFVLSFTAAAAEPAANTSCFFSYKPGSVKVFWTGYKFTEKTGAKGEFKELNLRSSSNAGTVEELILSTAVDIDMYKFETGDPVRDSNLLNSFFKKIKGPRIKGEVSSYQSGILKVKTNINGTNGNLAFLVTTNGSKFTAATDFDMIETFKMKKPHESISRACNVLHRGKDGKSKTWSQVSLALEGEIVNSCDPAAKTGASNGN